MASNFSIDSPFVYESAIQLPFTVTGNGKVADTTDPAKVWAYRVKALIGSAVGERILRPKYGLDLIDVAFNAQSIAEEVINREVEAAFAAYLPDLTLDSIELQFDADNATLNVDIGYILPNNVPSNITVGVVTIDPANPISEA